MYTNHFILESEKTRYEIAGMLEVHRKRLRTHYVDIIDQCQSNVKPICNHLYSREILSFSQKETILHQSIDYE